MAESLATVRDAQSPRHRSLAFLLNEQRSADARKGEYRLRALRCG
jgi:hypothetical protein